MKNYVENCPPLLHDTFKIYLWISTGGTTGYWKLDHRGLLVSDSSAAKRIQQVLDHINSSPAFLQTEYSYGCVYVTPTHSNKYLVQSKAFHSHFPGDVVHWD